MLSVNALLLIRYLLHRDINFRFQLSRLGLVRIVEVFFKTGNIAQLHPAFGQPVTENSIVHRAQVIVRTLIEEDSILTSRHSFYTNFTLWLSRLMNNKTNIGTQFVGFGHLRIVMVFHWGAAPETALATAVLYLVPGVPLINSLIDLIEGHLSSAWNRALFGASILLCMLLISQARKRSVCNLLHWHTFLIG